MPTFLRPDEPAIDADFAESRTKRDRDRVACFRHLRDLVYLHPQSGVGRCHCVRAVARSGGDRSEGHARKTTSRSPRTSSGMARGGGSESGGGGGEGREPAWGIIPMVICDWLFQGMTRSLPCPH